MRNQALKCPFRDKQEIYSLADSIVEKHYGSITPEILPVEIDAILEQEGFILKPVVYLPLENEVFAQISIDGKTIIVREQDLNGEIKNRYIPNQNSVFSL